MKVQQNFGIYERLPAALIKFYFKRKLKYQWASTDLATHFNINQRKKFPTVGLTQVIVPSTHGILVDQGLNQCFTHFNVHLETVLKCRF